MPAVALYANCDQPALISLLRGYGLSIEKLGDQDRIPGSYWGDSEAGLINTVEGHRILVRSDTPVHSILHETCHFICMDDSRRQRLGEATDPDAGNAGGDYDEENAVCYLQIILAGEIPGMDWKRMCRDMDSWGYTFRLGSAEQWFLSDAGDARQWLLHHRLIDKDGAPTRQIRTSR
jgi:hypothetical protein